MPSLVQRARSVAASVTRSVRSAARRLGSLFTRKSATPGLRRRPTEAITVEEYIEAVPRAPSPRPRTPSPRPRTPSPPRLTVNQIALAARLRKPRINNPLPPSQVSARAPRPATVPGGIAGPEGNTARRRVIAAKEAATAAASRAAEQAAIASQRAVLEETIDGISRLTPRNFKRLVREIEFTAFRSLHPLIHTAIVTRVSSDLNHDEFMMIRPDVRQLMSERAERLGLPLP